MDFLKKKNIKDKMMESFKKPLSYINIKSEKKYHFYSPITESAMTNTEFDSSGSDNDYSTSPLTRKIQIHKNQTNNINNYTQSDPKKLIFVPKSLSEQYNNNNKINNTTINNENMNPDNQNNIKTLSLSSTIPNNNTKKTLNTKPNIYHYSTTLSTLNKSKMLLPWYLKKRQTTFTKKELTTFYNYNKCSNYDKYENYYSRNQPVKDNIADISMDKTAIELKELHSTSRMNLDITENDGNPRQEKSELSENTDYIVENEIANAMNGIALKDVTFPTNQLNDVSNNNNFDLNDAQGQSLSMRSEDIIENNVTFEFQPESAYPVVSDNNNNKIYPHDSFESKNNDNPTSSIQYPVLPEIENYTIDKFVC